MAAWLAYLKSRLLLPPEPAGRRPPRAPISPTISPSNCERLEAMRGAAAQLMARDRLGRDVFARGAPEAVTRDALLVSHVATLVDLLRGLCADQDA